MTEKPPYFDEINALVKSIASALDLPEADVATAFEEGRADVGFDRLPDGRPVLRVAIAGRAATIGLGAAAEDDP